MYFKFCFCLIFSVLVIHCIEGAKIKDKPSKDKDNDSDKDKVQTSAIQSSETRPQYINQFSQSLKFLGSFFQIIQRQLNDTIISFNPNRPNPIFSALLSNPSLIPFALRRFREPLNEMITITNKLEKILSTTDPKQLENSNELQRLLQQLQRRLQSVFGPLMPHNGVMTRIPTSFPAALESFSNWVSQMASMLAIFSQTVRDVTQSSTQTTNLNPMSLFNRSDVPSEVESICSQINTLSLISSEINSRNITAKQGGILSILNGVVVTTLTSVLEYVANLLGLFNKASATTDSDELGQNEESVSLRNSTIVIPLTIKNVEDFQQLSFGVINPQNRLVIANILTKDHAHSENNDQNNTNLISRMSLNSLHSLMTSLVKDLRDINEPKILSALQCQLECFDCSIRNTNNYSEVQRCLKTLSTCIGTGL